MATGEHKHDGKPLSKAEQRAFDLIKGTEDGVLFRRHGGRWMVPGVFHPTKKPLNYVGLLTMWKLVDRGLVRFDSRKNPDVAYLNKK